MPRRPRPVSRRPPPNSTAAPSTTKKTVSQPPRPAAKRKLSSDGEESDGESEESEDSESSSLPEPADDVEDSEEGEVDVDAPRIAQWVDEEELNNVSEEDESESSEDEEDDRGVGPSNLVSYRLYRLSNCVIHIRSESPTKRYVFENCCGNACLIRAQICPRYLWGL